MSKKLVWSRKEGKFLAIELEDENQNQAAHINDELNELIDNLRAKEKEDNERIQETEHKERDKDKDKDKDKEREREQERELEREIERERQRERELKREWTRDRTNDFNEDADLSVNDLIDSLRTKELSHVLNEQNTSDDFWDIINSNEDKNQNKNQTKPKIYVPILPIKTNRIDSRTETQFIKRSYHDQYLLERAWYLLGHKVLTEEISINIDLLENPNIILPAKQIGNPSNVLVDENQELYKNVTIYKLNDESYIFAMSKDGIPGSFWGVGQNEDFSRPIEAIELFRLPGWSEKEYSLKLVFSRETFLITTLMIENGPAHNVEEIVPCGIEVLAADLFRVQL
jgi:hypothetical protein